MREGKLVIMVAPSGSGKSTMAHRLLRDFKELRFSVSATTRAPRAGETHGVEYFSLSDAEFDARVDQQAFLEWEMFYNGRRYGTLKSEVDHLLKKGYFILLDLEVNGALNVKRIYGDRCLAIFIEAPSLDILRQRLLARGTETEVSLALRLERAGYELQFRHHFDARVINDDLERTYQEIYDRVHRFIRGEPAARTSTVSSLL